MRFSSWSIEENAIFFRNYLCLVSNTQCRLSKAEKCNTIVNMAIAIIIWRRIFILMCKTTSILVNVAQNLGTYIESAWIFFSLVIGLNYFTSRALCSIPIWPVIIAAPASVQCMMYPSVLRYSPYFAWYMLNCQLWNTIPCIIYRAYQIKRNPILMLLTSDKIKFNSLILRSVFSLIFCLFNEGSVTCPFYRNDNFSRRNLPRRSGHFKTPQKLYLQLYCEAIHPIYIYIHQ